MTPSSSDCIAETTFNSHGIDKSNICIAFEAAMVLLLGRFQLSLCSRKQRALHVDAPKKMIQLSKRLVGAPLFRRYEWNCDVRRFGDCEEEATRQHLTHDKVESHFRFGRSRPTTHHTNPMNYSYFPSLH